MFVLLLTNQPQENKLLFAHLVSILKCFDSKQLFTYTRLLLTLLFMTFSKLFVYFASTISPGSTTSNETLLTLYFRCRHKAFVYYSEFSNTHRLAFKFETFFLLFFSVFFVNWVFFKNNLLERLYCSNWP